MPGIIDIYNQAASMAGSRHTLSDPNEKSREAELCNLWYTTARDQVLKAAPWGQASGNARLAVQVERDPDVDWVSSDPEPGWRFAYSAPSDMIHPRYISDFSRFKLSNAPDNSAIILCNSENVILHYTKKQTQPDAWGVDLRMAITSALAAYITLPLTGKLQRARLRAEAANTLIMSARANEANVDEAQLETLPEWITARGYSGTTSLKYFYPYGPAISVDSAVA